MHKHHSSTSVIFLNSKDALDSAYPKEEIFWIRERSNCWTSPLLCFESKMIFIDNTTEWTTILYGFDPSIHPDNKESLDEISSQYFRQKKRWVYFYLLKFVDSDEENASYWLYRSTHGHIDCTYCWISEGFYIHKQVFTAVRFGVQKIRERCSGILLSDKSRSPDIHTEVISKACLWNRKRKNSKSEELTFHVLNHTKAHPNATSFDRNKQARSRYRLNMTDGLLWLLPNVVQSQMWSQSIFSSSISALLLSLGTNYMV